ncbi:hypothetical protein GQ42DRAFT_178387 [Ramicandelaber brevisporus]|nr:hypothetical protein GQ42DRAFT_178387 [Ramicandelaber brevisporus]
MSEITSSNATSAEPSGSISAAPSLISTLVGGLFLANGRKARTASTANLTAKQLARLNSLRTLPCYTIGGLLVAGGVGMLPYIGDTQLGRIPAQLAYGNEELVGRQVEVKHVASAVSEAAAFVLMLKGLPGLLRVPAVNFTFNAGLIIAATVVASECAYPLRQLLESRSSEASSSSNASQDA